MIFDYREEEEKDDNVKDLQNFGVEPERDDVPKIDDFDPGPEDCVRLVVSDGEIKLFDNPEFKTDYEKAVDSVVAVWNYLKTTPMKNTAKTINDVLMKYAHLFKIDSSKIKFVDLKNEDPTKVITLTEDKTLITPGSTKFLKNNGEYTPENNELVDRVLSPSWEEDNPMDEDLFGMDI